MTKYYQLSRLTFSLVFLIFLTTNIHAQFSAYHGIIFPYDTPNKVIHSIGSITYAFPDYSANIQNNPVSLSFIQNPRIYISFNQEISRYSILKYKYYMYISGIEKTKTLPAKKNIYPGFVSGALPFSLFKRSFVIGVSINKTHSPEYEIWETNKEDPELIFKHQRKGDVWNATIGICYRLTSDINIGLGWSKWFGNWSWHNENTLKTISSEGKFRYFGNVVNIGLIKQSQNLSYCFIFHFPFTLMKADNVSINLRYGIERYNINQHFNGAFKAGIVYRWNNRFSLSSGYRYQEKASLKQTPVKIGLGNYERKEEYDMTHQVSIAGEYIFHFKNIKIPTFLAYRAYWWPNVHSKGYYGVTNYQDFIINDSFFYPINNIALGLNAHFSSFIFHLTGQWNMHSISYNLADHPITASAMIPKSFKAKKSTFLFNFGVSYDFK